MGASSAVPLAGASVVAARSAARATANLIYPKRIVCALEAASYDMLNGAIEKGITLVIGYYDYLGTSHKVIIGRI